MRNPKAADIHGWMTGALLLCLSTGFADAQTGTTIRSDPGFRLAAPGAPSTSLSMRRVQADARAPVAQPPASEAQPPEPISVPPAGVEPGLPDSESGDLNLPAAESAIGGGEPTISALQAEEARAEAARKDTRGLLMKFLEMPEDSDWRVRGWIQNSFTGNANGFGNGENFGVYPNWKANQWMGNQYYLILEKPLKQEDSVNWGFRIDNLFGNDWQFNYMQGLFNGAFHPGQFAGYDMAQLFGEIHLPILTKNGIDVKGGRWYTLEGYEVVPAPGRPLLSVPYMFNYGQPFTHFGVLTTMRLTDRINLYNGAINGWDRWINIHYQWGYIGGFAWTSPDEKTTLALRVVWGPNQFPRFLPADQQLYPTGYINIPSVAGLVNPGYHRNDRTLFTTVLTHKWSAQLTQVMETDQGMERSVPGLGATDINGIPVNAAPANENWYSFGNWFLYNFSDKLMGVWRSEVFWDEEGGRAAKLAGRSIQTRPVGDRYYEITLGARIKPYDWLWVRPEIRYDWSQYHPAYNNNTRKSQLTMAFDVILFF